MAVLYIINSLIILGKDLHVVTLQQYYLIWNHVCVNKVAVTSMVCQWNCSHKNAEPALLKMINFKKLKKDQLPQPKKSVENPVYCHCVSAENYKKYNIRSGLQNFGEDENFPVVDTKGEIKKNKYYTQVQGQMVILKKRISVTCLFGYRLKKMGIIF